MISQGTFSLPHFTLILMVAMADIYERRWLVWKATGVSVALVARHSCAEAVVRCVDSVTRCRSDEDVCSRQARLDDAFRSFDFAIQNGFSGLLIVQLQETCRVSSARRLLRSGRNLKRRYPHPSISAFSLPQLSLSCGTHASHRRATRAVSRPNSAQSFGCPKMGLPRDAN